MKKILIAAMAAIAFAGVSCSECSKDSCATENAANQPLSEAYGTYVGSIINNEMQPNHPDKAAFIKGLKMAMATQGDENTAYGLQVGIQMIKEINQLSEEGVQMDKSTVLKSFLAAYNNDSLTTQDIRESLAQFHKGLQDAQEQAAIAAQNATASTLDTNKVAGDEYVAKLAGEDPAVTTTPSGLTYKIEKAGEEGTNPDETATVRVHYTGKHLDGRVFDSSVERGEPATFNLQGVVPGFREGIMLLGKGGKATLYIPGSLAYGDAGAPQAGIQPNEMLVFDVELLDVQ